MGSSLWIAIVLFIHPVLPETISEIFGDDFLEDSLYFESGPFGSNNDGTWFTDFRQMLDGSRFEPRHWPDAINLRAGQGIDGIQLSYGSYRGLWHGGREGGFLNKIRLYNGDRITKVTGRSGIGPGAQVDQLTFHTQTGQVLGPYGGEGQRWSRHFVAKPREIYSELSGKRLPCYLGWISGKADYNRLTAISFHWKCPKLERAAEELVPTTWTYPWDPWEPPRNSAIKTSSSNWMLFIVTCYSLAILFYAIT